MNDVMDTSDASTRVFHNEEEKNVFIEALEVFIYSNDLVCTPSQTQVQNLLERFAELVASGGYCFMLQSEYISNIANIDFFMDLKKCSNDIPMPINNDGTLNTMFTRDSFVVRVLNYNDGTKDITIYNTNFVVPDKLQKKKIYIAPVALVYFSQGSNGLFYPGGVGHQTALIFDYKKRVIDFFDPYYSSDSNVNTLIKEKFEKFFLGFQDTRFSAWEFYSSVELHRLFSNLPGWQTLSDPFVLSDPLLQNIMTPEQIRARIPGYCVAWSLLYAILRTITKDTPFDNPGTYLVAFFPEALINVYKKVGKIDESVSITQDSLGYALNGLVRNFTINLISSLFEPDQFFKDPNLDMIVENIPHIKKEHSPESCGNDRLDNASEDIITQLGKEGKRKRIQLSESGKYWLKPIWS